MKLTLQPYLVGERSHPNLRIFDNFPAELKVDFAADFVVGQEPGLLGELTGLALEAGLGVEATFSLVVKGERLAISSHSHHQLLTRGPQEQPVVHSEVRVEIVILVI